MKDDMTLAHHTLLPTPSCHFSYLDIIRGGWQGKAQVEKKNSDVFTHTALPGNIMECSGKHVRGAYERTKCKQT